MRRAVVLLALLCARTAFAECPVPRGASAGLEKLSDEQRLDFIRASIARDANDTNVWTALWVAGNGGLLAGTGGIAPFYPASGRITLFVGVGATALAALPLVLLPPSIMKVGPGYERLVWQRKMDTCALIRFGESTMLRIAREEASIGGALPQVINVLYNVGVGLILTFVFHQWQAGISAIFSGTAIGEGVMLTQPKEMPLDLQHYLHGETDRGTVGPQIGFQLYAQGSLLKLSF